MTTSEVVDGIMAEPSYGDDASGLRNRSRSNLLYLSRTRTVVREGERVGATWRLT